MSTFGGLSVAWTGLTAARAGLDVIGQNIANVNTEGYTRQRPVTSATGTLTSAGPFDTAVRGAVGVSVDGVQRLGNAILDGQVRTTSATAGAASFTKGVMQRLETSLDEPSKTGLASTLADFWAAWQNLANQPSSPSAGNLVIEAGATVAARIATGYQETASTWLSTRAQATEMVGEINALASQVAGLNDRIRVTSTAGGSVNELMDQRALATTRLAELTGATVIERPNNQVDVLVGGGLLVSEERARTLAISGAMRVEDAASSPITISWSQRPGEPVGIDSGALGAAAALLGPAASGGSIASAAATYDALATRLAASVNSVHSTGATPSGTTGAAFFGFDPAQPAALGLRVLPTSVAGVAAGAPGAGGADGSIADALAGLAQSPTGADASWAEFVARIGVDTRRAADLSAAAGRAASSAAARQASGAAVDMDEETASLLTYQYAYQGAARMITAVDQMLDTLINRTGLVGR